jgi:SAM-dependent methyltransferase
MSGHAMSAERLPVTQLAAIYLVSMPLAWLASAHGLPWDATVAGCAVGLCWMIGLAPWWLAINAVFVPALSWSLAVEIPPSWALGALVTLVVVYGRIWKSRVPLFFSSARTQQALEGLLRDTAPDVATGGRIAFLDVGCGDARVLTRLAALRPECRFEGVEQAYAPWLLARLRCAFSQGHARVRRGDLWTLDLGAYDVVYAYLSPAVMPELWRKARREMRAGALLVSAFDVPGAPRAHTVEVGDTMRTRLHAWRMAGNGRTTDVRDAK